MKGNAVLEHFLVHPPMRATESAMLFYDHSAEDEMRRADSRESKRSCTPANFRKTSLIWFEMTQQFFRICRDLMEVLGDICTNFPLTFRLRKQEQTVHATHRQGFNKLQHLKHLAVYYPTISGAFIVVSQTPPRCTSLTMSANQLRPCAIKQAFLTKMAGDARLGEAALLQTAATATN